MVGCICGVKMVKIKKIRKWFIMSELFLLAGFIIFLYFYSQPRLIAPSSGLIINDFDFHFEIENADKIVVARDADFKEPIIIEKGKEIIIVPGTYYWKAVSSWGSSEVRNFTITTSLILSLNDKGGVYGVVNSGNVDANFTGEGNSVVIPSKDTYDIGINNGSYEGRQI